MEEEESPDIVLSSFRNAGVSIPANVSSVSDLSPPTFVSICAQCLNLIDHHQTNSAFPTSLPDSTVDKFKICTDMALAVKRLGYMGDMSYYKLLYPSEEDLYKLSRFLVERLSESIEGVKIADLKGVDDGRKLKDAGSSSSLADETENPVLSYQKEKLKDLNLHNMVPELSNSKEEDASFSGSSILAEEGKSRRSAFGSEETLTQRDDEHLQKTRHEINQFPSQEELLAEEVNAKMTELQHLEEEYELLKAATEIAFDDQHPIDYYLEQLNKQVDSGKHSIMELKSQWDTFTKPSEEKKRSLLESLYSNMPEAQEKFLKLREVEQEKLSILSETGKRREEYSKLCMDLVKQPKLPPRTSYIERIKEITRNSRKQDADIGQILTETRELQLESNFIQERLHRTYSVLEEMVCREAKKEPVGREAYRRLTSIHDSFEKISEKILATDRNQREIAELEKKLAAMATRSLNVDKLQADLDAIMKENEYLEQSLKHN